MTNYYKPGPVKVTKVEPDPRPKAKKKKDEWKKDSDVIDYQSRNVEKVRRRLERTKRR